MFRDAKCVPIGVLEPCHPGAGRGRPDTQFVLLHIGVVVALELNSDLLQIPYGRAYVRHLPAKHRARRRRKFFAHAKTQHDAISIEYERERRFFAEQTQTQFVTIEFLRALYINDGQEADDIALAKPRIWRHAVIM